MRGGAAVGACSDEQIRVRKSKRERKGFGDVSHPGAKLWSSSNTTVRWRSGGTRAAAELEQSGRRELGFQGEGSGCDLMRVKGVVRAAPL